jgi:hypothetical protein
MTAGHNGETYCAARQQGGLRLRPIRPEVWRPYWGKAGSSTMREIAETAISMAPEVIRTGETRLILSRAVWQKRVDNSGDNRKRQCGSKL